MPLHTAGSFRVTSARLDQELRPAAGKLARKFFAAYSSACGWPGNQDLRDRLTAFDRLSPAEQQQWTDAALAVLAAGDVEIGPSL